MSKSTSTIPRCKHGIYSPAGDGRPSWGCQGCNPQANSHPLMKTGRAESRAESRGQTNCAQFMEIGEGLRISAGFAIMSASER